MRYSADKILGNPGTAYGLSASVGRHPAKGCLSVDTVYIWNCRKASPERDLPQGILRTVDCPLSAVGHIQAFHLAKPLMKIVSDKIVIGKMWIIAPYSINLVGLSG